MPDSDYIYERGEAITVGTHGETEYVFASGEPIPNTGVSALIFESGVGLGGGAVWEDDFEDGTIADEWAQIIGSWTESSGAIYETSASNESVLRRDGNENEATGEWEFHTQRDSAGYANYTVPMEYGLGANDNIEGYGFTHRNAHTGANQSTSYEVDFQVYTESDATVLLNHVGNDSQSEVRSYTLKRYADDSFEVYHEGVSQGTVSDTTFTGEGSKFELQGDGGHTFEWHYASYTT